MQTENFDHASWNQLIRSLPNPHLLQSWEWAQVKAQYGWQPMPLTWRSQTGTSPVAAAMVLKRSIPLGGFAKKMCLLYIPKGPLLDWNDSVLRQQVLNDLQDLSRQQGAVFVKMDPDVLLGTGVPGMTEDKEDPSGQGVIADLKKRGWKVSGDQIQFRNSVLIDLTAPEDELLARMKQKTRYNVRLAEKKGVSIRAGTLADLPVLYKLYAETSIRDGFVIRDEGYYQTVWKMFLRDGDPRAVPLIAEVDGAPAAAIFLFIFADRAYYLYGMSSQAHRELMPNHLLQWKAICLAKNAGCTRYDLWGAPDEFNENDGMWGVFRFKEGLGGQVVRTIGAWDFTPAPLLYRLYTRVIPRLLDILRARGRQQTRQNL